MKGGIFRQLVDNEARGAILQCWRSREVLIGSTVMEEQGDTVLEELVRYAVMKEQGCT